MVSERENRILHLARSRESRDETKCRELFLNDPRGYLESVLRLLSGEAAASQAVTIELIFFVWFLRDMDNSQHFIRVMSEFADDTRSAVRSYVARLICLSFSLNEWRKYNAEQRLQMLKAITAAESLGIDSDTRTFVEDNHPN